MEPGDLEADWRNAAETAGNGDELGRAVPEAGKGQR